MSFVVASVMLASFAFGYWQGRDAARSDAWSMLVRRAWLETAGTRRALWSASDRLDAPWWSIDWGGRWTR